MQGVWSATASCNSTVHWSWVHVSLTQNVNLEPIQCATWVTCQQTLDVMCPEARMPGCNGCPCMSGHLKPGHWHAEKEKRATAVALKLEEERKAGESARLAKAEQHRAVQQQQKQIAQEVCVIVCRHCQCVLLSGLLHHALLSCCHCKWYPCWVSRCHILSHHAETSSASSECASTSTRSNITDVQQPPVPTSETLLPHQIMSVVHMYPGMPEAQLLCCMIHVGA